MNSCVTTFNPTLKRIHLQFWKCAPKMHCCFFLFQQAEICFLEMSSQTTVKNIIASVAHSLLPPGEELYQKQCNPLPPLLISWNEISMSAPHINRSESKSHTYFELKWAWNNHIQLPAYCCTWYWSILAIILAGYHQLRDAMISAEHWLSHYLTNRLNMIVISRYILVSFKPIPAWQSIFSTTSSYNQST